jgi:hypothetical protein
MKVKLVNMFLLRRLPIPLSWKKPIKSNAFAKVTSIALGAGFNSPPLEGCRGGFNYTND